MEPWLCRGFSLAADSILCLIRSVSGARTYPDVHPGGARRFKNLADFISRCASGEDIVDKRNMLAIQTLLAVKSFD